VLSDSDNGAAGVQPGVRNKIGLALAAGAPEGAIYEIGALRAIDEALDGLDLNNHFLYVGVSAGAFLCANLANDLTTAQMCRAIVSQEPGEHPFTPETFFTPALGELGRSLLKVPGLLGRSLWSYVTHFSERSLLGSLTRVSRALPVGVFDNEPIRAYLHKIYTMKNRTDDFRRLGKRLVVVATDLDSAQPVRFGEKGLDHVPISVAVQASGALPGLYSPVEIDGRHYVDGVLLKTLHASVALEAGAELLICVNPIVPVDTIRAVEQGLMRSDKLLHRGLPTVLSQTFRTLVRSRLEVGMAAYEKKYKDRDVVLLEPKRDDYKMFFTNIFGLSERRAVCEHAYQSTRQTLLARYGELAPVFARHGVTLRRDVLEEPRHLWDQVGLTRRKGDKKAGGRRKTDLEASGHTTVRDLDAALSRLEKLVADQLVADREPEEEKALIPLLEQEPLSPLAN
jgi:predicted acylesterase/phospholipase RssA